MTIHERKNKDLEEEIVAPHEAQELAFSLFEQARKMGLFSREAERRFSLQIKKMKALEFIGQAIFPSWVQAWQLQYAHAAVDETRHIFDFRRRGLGCVQLSMRLVRDVEEDGGALRISWESESYNEEGWWLAVFLQDAEDCSYIGKLQGSQKGSDIYLTSDELGFDPKLAPFRFVVYPG
jgi:hypothetical protein